MAGDFFIDFLPFLLDFILSSRLAPSTTDTSEIRLTASKRCANRCNTAIARITFNEQIDRS
jgi:hypothetical protein